LVLAFTAEYSVNGTLAPVPLGTLNGESAQYGGVPGLAWAYAVAGCSAGRATPTSVARAATRTAANRPLRKRRRVDERLGLFCS
jgi:hypothetical protein